MLKGKVSLITGGQRGIGLAIAKKLATMGSDIVINAIVTDESAEIAKKEIESLGVKAMLIIGDVSKFDDAKRMVDETVKEFGKLDILVNNAGITRDGLMMRMSESDFDSVISVNLKGTFNLMKHATPIMMKQRSGSIINLSSVVGVQGNAGQSNYSASKAGIIGLTKSMAKELGSRNVRVNAVAPGFIQTKMTEVLSDDVKANILSQIPFKRMGTPEEIANVVAFLASDEASYVTGQVIGINGGMA